MGINYRRRIFDLDAAAQTNAFQRAIGHEQQFVAFETDQFAGNFPPGGTKNITTVADGKPGTDSADFNKQPLHGGNLPIIGRTVQRIDRIDDILH